MLKGTLPIARTRERSRWYPHAYCSSPAGSVGSAAARELPDSVPELVGEGVIIIQGNAGCGKTQLVSHVREKLSSRAYPQFNTVVVIDFAKVGRRILSWRQLAKYLVEEGELTSDEETDFVRHLESKSGSIAMILDNIVDDLSGHLKKLLVEACGEIGRDDSASALEGVIEGVVCQCVCGPKDAKIFLRMQLETMEKKMRREEFGRLRKSIDPLVLLLEQSAGHLKQLFYGPGGRVLVSRQDYSDLIAHRHQIALGGFESPATALEFMKYHLSEVLNTTRTQPLDLYLNMHPLIKSLCNIPKLAIILCNIYAGDSRCIKDTETSLVHRVVLRWMQLELPEFREKSLYKLPPDVKEHFLHLCKLAFGSILHRAGRQDEQFPLMDFDINAVNLQSGFSSLDEVNRYGLIQSKGNTVHSFIHPVIQEFLAAFYISSQPQNHQIFFYYEQFPKNVDSFLNVSLFHFGLTRLETEEFLNPSKIIIAAMIESLAHVIEKKAEFRLELQKLIVGCLFEAQDTTLVKHFTQQFTPLMNINFPDVRALDDARMTAQMIFVILQSGINLWEIIIPNENTRGKTDSLVFPITMIPVQ